MSIRRALALLAATLGLFAMGTGLVVAQDKQKVVYHINDDDPKHQKAALNNIQNHINAIGKDKLDLKVVLHGNGLALLLDPEAVSRVKGFKSGNANEVMGAAIDNLKGQGIEFKVCANTLKGRNIDYKRDMYYVTEKDIVPSGVAELAILQGKGYAYIKP